MSQGAMFDEFSQGGLIDDADVTVKSARFIRWDYLGTQPEVLALQVLLEDTEGKTHDEKLSAGELKFFVPSEDGKKAIPVGTATKLNSNTNIAHFVQSIFNADTRGELAGKLKTTDDISILDGLKFHLRRVDQPKRSGLPTQTNPDGSQKRTPQRIEVSKINAYPWESAPAAGTATAAAPAAAGATQQAPAGDADLDAMTMGVLFSILGANNNSIAKTAIAGKVFNDPEAKALDAPIRNKVLARIVNDAFLKGEMATGAGIKYDGKTVSL